MASLRRVRRRACEGKQRFDTKEAATGHLISRRRTMARGGVSTHGMEVYRCGFCGGWHIGHRPGRRNVSAAQVNRKKGAGPRAQ